MRLGDVVEWGGHRWIVRRIERHTRTAILNSGELTNETVPDDLDKTKPTLCQVISNPPQDWPFVAITQRPKFGRLLRITRPSLAGTTAELVAFHDWVVADPIQPGGAIFLNPSLNLRHGDQLLAVYERGNARIQIPREFLSTSQRVARATAPEEEAPRISVYDRLRRNDFADDEDE
jgi:hypothetical protein